MAIIFNNSKKKTKVDHDHNYGGFWLGNAANDFEYEGRTTASSVVKALKIRNYQKAIANFVKILSQKDVPVVVKGTESYTDGKTRVVIAGNVSDKNFDVTAGLALHEASHIKYTDFQVIQDYMGGSFNDMHKMRVKNMLNWIEDRRIDSLVFRSCPGYKAYYHKLYDHYFRCKEVAKMLKGKQFREEKYDNYEAHIINMMNTEFDRNALQVLSQVVALIDVNNILRLQNTAEVLELAEQVVTLIENHIDQLPSTPTPKPQEEEEPQEGDDETPEGDDEGQGGQGGDDEEQEDGNGSSGQGGEGDDEEEELIDLTLNDVRQIAEKLEKQRQLLNGSVEKKEINKQVASKLKNVQNSETDFTAVGEGSYKNDCVIYRLDKETSKIATLYSRGLVEADIWKRYRNNEITYAEKEREVRALPLVDQNALPVGLSRTGSVNAKQVAEGLQMGAILGRKLQTRRESRELVTNRLRTGKIDAKRIAHAGYGIENVFNQIHIDKYKNANIHLTIDASGSMGGERWNNSIKMAAALGKAVSMIEGLELQISMRETTEGDNPVVSIIYDSRTNKLNHLRMVLEMYGCNSMTPEGLCLEAMIKKNLFKPSNSECDSYMINICDGAPGTGTYGGYAAINHTKRQVKRINNELGIQHVGFFFGEDSGTYGQFGRFKEMYGVGQSKAIPDANNATQIADHMNKKLMTK